jgi:hypothetical protein
MINRSRRRNKLTHAQRLDWSNARRDPAHRRGTTHTRTHNTCPEHLHGTRARQERSLDVFIPTELADGGKLTVRRIATPKLPHLFLFTHRYVQLCGTYTKPSYQDSQSDKQELRSRPTLMENLAKQEPSTGHWELCQLTEFFFCHCCYMCLILSKNFFDCHRKATLQPEIPP